MKFANKLMFIDYEGTLSENPKGSGDDGSATLEDLLFRNMFKDAKPNKKMLRLLKNLDPKQIYVLGVIETNVEVKQKYDWLKQNYPFILKRNIIFISEDHQKVEVLNLYREKLKLDRSDIVLIDDKESHLNLARRAGYECYNVKGL